jgi:hypothetical protein
MYRSFRLLAVALVWIGCAAPVAGWQTPAAPAQVTAADLTPEQMEQFLLTAKVISKKRADKGVTDTIRATFSDGRIVHEAQIQTVDIHRSVFNGGRASEVNFKDTYRFNIGAYRLARLLGMSNVPMSVKRRIDGKDAAVTWWIDDVMFDEGGRLKHKPMQGPDPERTSRQDYVRLAFDELIQNKDRNTGNLVWTKDWTLWLIDHTRAFRLGKELMKPEQLLRADRRFLDAIRGLTLEAMTAAMGDVMMKDEISAVLDRRNLLLAHFEDRIKRVGEAAVLFTN